MSEKSDSIEAKEQNNSMKIIAFDIECSINLDNHSEMMIFAYAETDGRFREIDAMEQYVHCKKPTGRLRQLIKYDEEKRIAAPKYAEIYENVKEVLTRLDTIYLAHDAIKDIEYLFNESNMYRLPTIECKVYDTQKILRNNDPCLKGYALDKVTAEWGIEHDPHECLSDAKACLGIIRHIAERERISLCDVIERYGKDALVTTDDCREFKRKKSADRRLRTLHNKEIEVTSNEMSGVKVCFTESFHEGHPDIEYAIASEVIAHGGDYTSSVLEANLLLRDRNPWSGRLQCAYNHPEKNIRVEYIDRFIHDKKDWKFSKICYDYKPEGAESFSFSEKNRHEECVQSIVFKVVKDDED